MLQPRSFSISLHISPFISAGFGFTYFGALLFGAYTFKIAMSS